jgi:hypothetical protein
MTEKRPRLPELYTIGNKEYKLCAKPGADKGTVYFFVSSKADVPPGSKQVSMPPGYTVDTSWGFPVLVRK